MKGTITQYVTLGIMLLIIVLIVSLFPAQHESNMTGQATHPHKATSLSVRNNPGKVRAD